MSDRVQQYVEVCHCGCAKATHWEEKHNCLGMQCECRMYIDRDDPDRKERTKKAQATPLPFDDIDTGDPPPTPIPSTPVVTPRLPYPFPRTWP